MSSLTVYIPCRNAERFVGRCLDAVRAQTLPPSEMIVVDDGSVDRTAEVARARGARVIPLPSHPGLAAARNAAVKAARGGLVASLDADCLPDAGWLASLARAMDETGAAGAGGRLEERFRSAPGDRWRAVHMRQNWGGERIVNPPFLFGCNTVFSKGALEEAGLYDERFRTNGEDVDLSRRLMARGRTLVYEPSAAVSHLKRDTLVSVLRADWRWGYRSTGETAKYRRVSHIAYHNLTNARYRLGQDLSAREWRLLPADALLFLLHTLWDIRYAREAGLLARGRGGGGGLAAFKGHLAELSRDRFLRNPDGLGGAPAEPPAGRGRTP